jgi:hypothetical protein
MTHVYQSAMRANDVFLITLSVCSSDNFRKRLIKCLTAKRLRPKAQGCRALAATLGPDGQLIQPQRGCANRNATQNRT